MFANFEYVDSLFKQWQQNPDQTSTDWDHFFCGLDQAVASVEKSNASCSHERLIEESLKRLFREKGYLAAPLQCLYPDPWQVERRALFDKEFSSLETLAGRSLESMALDLREIYCSRIGFEPPAHPSEAKWLYDKIEQTPLHTFSKEADTWQLLIKANRLERFLHKQFVGQKRFSLEGEESLIPMIEKMIRAFAQGGGSHVILGSTHRGRLNLMAHCVDKPYEAIFQEFNEHEAPDSYQTGDVKYHKGYVATRMIDEHPVLVELISNPSHMESIDTVLMGMARGMQRGRSAHRVLPILLHGDGAFAGQGVVYEALQLSGIEGYGCEGVIHVVVNNQVVFTAGPKETRSTFFCSDIARSFGLPVFHVSAEDPDACLYVAHLAFEYRKRYGRDVVIDLIGYRRHGHNESDEPRYTQPLVYEAIHVKEDIATQYAKQSKVDPEVLEAYEKEIEQLFLSSFEKTKVKKVKEEERASIRSELPSHHSQTLGSQLIDRMQAVDTKIEMTRLHELIQETFTLPASIQVHKKLETLYQERQKHLFQEGDLDWASAELLAYASLLREGHGVRLSGEDAVRGTFSHRHIGLFDTQENQYYFPLKSLEMDLDTFEALNSPLSEFGVLGFEYGYSLARGNDLVIWEAQFGDFSNEAQVIIDQYLASAQSKWGVESRLTLFLPHGFEGQGPEHSSARIERFLGLSSHGNWCLANPTTPSQFFHLLRRQVLQPISRPLVVFTPKSLLRHPKCRSPQLTLTQERFYEMMLDRSEEETTILVMTSGKLYYEVQERVTRYPHVALLRIEQLYPLTMSRWHLWIQEMTYLKRVIWIQEEPINMGPASWIRHHMRPECDRRDLEWLMIGREEANSIATGYHTRHVQEQTLLLDELEEHLGIPSNFEPLSP